MTDSLLWIFNKNPNQHFGFYRKTQLQDEVLLFFGVNITIIIIINRYSVLATLKDKNTLKQFHISDTLEWCNGTIDIAPEYIFEHGELVDDENGLPVAAEAPIDYEK